MVNILNNSNYQRALAVANRLWRTSRSTLICTLALLMSAIATAADWEIDPVRIELSPEQQTAAITLRNASDQPTSIQIEVVAWSQVDGKDVYSASRELLVSPPIVTIAAKGEQVVRAALRRSADASKELSYRINLQELPPPPTPGFNGVQVALRVGLPVFVQSARGEAAPQMTWNAVRMPGNKLKIAMKNQGNAHVQVTDFSLYLPGGNQIVGGESGSSYVMPGQSHEWLLSMASSEKLASDRVHLKAYTDAGDVDTDLVLDKP